MRVGTADWAHRHWRGRFYPEDLPSGEWLPYYAEAFSCVEVSGAFHRLPGTADISRWCGQTGPDFRFAIVCPREITHDKRLKHCGDALAAFLLRLERFGDRLGPILFRLPARWRASPRRLSGFLAGLPDGRDYAFEFPDRSWHTAEVRDLLAAHGSGFCLVDGAAGDRSLDTGSGVSYVRLPGPHGDGVAGYHVPALRTWAGSADGWRRRGREAYLVFGNDERGNAARNARTLRDLAAGKDPDRSALR